MEEFWKPIKNYESLYEVSNLGRVKALTKYIKCRAGKLRRIEEKILHPNTDTNGYLSIQLCKDGIHKRFRIHRLVAESFIPNPQNLPCIDHINTNQKDNNVKNLKWVSYSENNKNPLTSRKMSLAKSGTNCFFYGKVFGNKPIISIDSSGTITKYSSIKEAEREGYNYRKIQNSLY